MLDGLDNASIEMEEAKVCFASIPKLHLTFCISYYYHYYFCGKGWSLLYLLVSFSI